MSHTNLRTINSTEINNSGAFRVGDNLSSGTTGQVLKSNGDFIAPSWETDIDTTYQGSATIDIDTTTDPDTINVIKVPNDLTISQNGTIIDTFNGSVVKTIDLVGKYIAGDGIDISGHPIPHIEADTDEITITHNLAGAEKLSVLKVPNTLTFTGYDTGTFDGSSPLTINLTDNQLNLLAGSGIIINNTGGFNRIITADIDNITLGWTPPSPNKQIEVRKVPNALTFTGYDTGTFDGSSPLTINLVDTDTTYSAGANIAIDGANKISLKAAITGMTDITYLSGFYNSTLKGNDYPTKQTTATYLDLSSTTNIIPGGVLATKIQRTSLLKSFTNVYSEYSSNFRTSFKAQSGNVMVEFRAIVRADNLIFYGGLYDYNAGAYIADCRNRFNYNDETDQDTTTMTWWMRNLTPGTTYYISPYFRGSASSVYIYAGHSGTIDGFAPAIMRIIDGGNNVSIY
jgi:hypothetical protein